MNVNELMIGDWVLVDNIHALETGAMMPARNRQGNNFVRKEAEWRRK